MDKSPTIIIYGGIRIMNNVNAMRVPSVTFKSAGNYYRVSNQAVRNIRIAKAVLLNIGAIVYQVYAFVINLIMNIAEYVWTNTFLRQCIITLFYGTIFACAYKFMFAAGMAEHPHTDPTIRALTAGFQTCILGAIFFIFKQFAGEFVWTLVDVFNSEDEEDY